MRVTAFVLALIAAFVFCCSPTATAYPQTKPDISSAVPCDVHAYVIDRDRQGLNVRSGAGRNFEKIGNLPWRDYTGIAVHITGSNGDWVQIDSAVGQSADDDEKIFFKGVGWLYGPLPRSDRNSSPGRRNTTLPTGILKESNDHTRTRRA